MDFSGALLDLRPSATVLGKLDIFLIKRCPQRIFSEIGRLVIKMMSLEEVGMCGASVHGWKF